MRVFVLERFSLGFVVCDRGVQIFQKSRSHLKILGDMQQVAYWGPTDIRRHRTKFSPPRATWHPGFVQSWLMACCQCFVITIYCKHQFFHLIMAVRHGNVIVNIHGVHYSIGSIATRLRAGRSGVRIPAEQRHFFLFSISTRPAVGTTQPPLQWLPDFFPWRKTIGAWRFTSHPDIAPRLTTNGAVPLLSPYALMAWTMTTPPPPLYCALYALNWAKSTGLHILIWNPLCMFLHYSLEQICRLGVGPLFERSLRLGVFSTNTRKVKPSDV